MHISLYLSLNKIQLIHHINEYQLYLIFQYLTRSRSPLRQLLKISDELGLCTGDPSNMMGLLKKFPLKQNCYQYFYDLLKTHLTFVCCYFLRIIVFSHSFTRWRAIFNPCILNRYTYTMGNEQAFSLNEYTQSIENFFSIAHLHCSVIAVAF